MTSTSGSGATPRPRMQQLGNRAAAGAPWWLNWTTVRGAGLIGAGLTVMVGPREEALLVSLFGILFVGWAAGEVWFVFLRRNRPTGDARDPDSSTAWHGLPPVSRIAMGLVLVAAAVLLFMDDLPFSVVVGGVLVARGILVAVNVLGPAGAGARRDGLLRVLMLMIVGTTVILVPDTAVLALRAGLGVGSIALGGIVVSMGLRRTGEGGDGTVQRPISTTTPHRGW